MGLISPSGGFFEELGDTLVPGRECDTDTAESVTEGVYTELDAEARVEKLDNTRMHDIGPITARGDRRVGWLIEEACKRGDTCEMWTENIREAPFDDEVFFRERELNETVLWRFIHNNVDPVLREETSARERVGSA